eukprot:g2353.t1
MGSQPRITEGEGASLLTELIGDRFRLQFGHEIKADVFVQPKTGGANGVQDGASRWIPLQLKVTKKITPAWRRKIRLILRRDKQKLRGIVLVGISLDPGDDCFVHLVHANRSCDSFDVSSPHFMTPPANLVDQLQGFWNAKLGTSLDHPDGSCVFSPATLTEHEARNDFQSLLAGTGLSYEVARSEGEPVDGSTGANYTPEDADYLLLHAREDPLAVGLPFRIYGSALISFQQLQEQGYLHTGDGQPGRAILSMYPDAPGVRTVRETWIEATFTKRNNVAASIIAELTRNDS